MKTGTKAALVIVTTIVLGMSLAIATGVVGYMLFSSSDDSTKAKFTDVNITTTDVVVKEIPKGHSVLFDMQDHDRNGQPLKYYVTLKTATGQYTLEMPAQAGELKWYFEIMELEFSLKPGQGPVRATLRLTDL